MPVGPGRTGATGRAGADARCSGVGAPSDELTTFAADRPVERAADDQRVSLWSGVRRSHLQYFFISMRSRSLTLFLVVM